MQRHLLRICVFLIVGVTSALNTHAQDSTKPTSVDPRLLEWENAKIVKEYTIADISISGIRHLDTAIVLSISGLQVGDKFTHPGNDIFAKAISNLWRQKLFSNIQVYVTKVEGENVYVEINVQERPRLGNFRFIGIKKSEAEELQGKIGLAKQTIITENMRRNIKEITSKYYTDKGFQMTTVRIEEKKDTAFVNSNSLTIYVDKGNFIFRSRLK
ncbi:MAG: POTRA domain-containing protein [Chitinophagales bacterium]